LSPEIALWRHRVLERRAGVVIKVNSTVTLRPLPIVGVYRASKAAVNAFTESLAAEVSPFGVIKAETVAVRRLRDQGAVVAIDDDGPGIPPEAREAVFQPSFRLETSRSRTTGGSGLGFAIVKQIADALGARLALSTSPEGGLRVTVAFPSAT